ncbi:hypothetical protein [Sphingomonas sp.]|uniref:hypothetical protein n=1 Tax=Sphingomonas sp. TaxID=28214 RepID=UPI003AFF9C64
MTNTDLAFYLLGIACLSCIAVLAAATLLVTLIPNWRRIVGAFFPQTAALRALATQHQESGE